MACEKCKQYRRDLSVAVGNKKVGKTISISLEASAELLRQKIASLQARKKRASAKTD